MEKIKSYEEDAGVKSSMRIKSYLTLFFTFLFTWFYLIVDKKPIDTMFLAFFTLLLVASFIPQYLQKIAELKKEETQILSDTNKEEVKKDNPIVEPTDK